MKIFLIILCIFICFYSFSFEEIGMASWYGPKFHGKKTANGEIFNTHDYTAAHKSLPFGSILEITSLENSKSIIVRINDRGPFAKGRIIDLSMAAARKLDMIISGTMKVKIKLLELGDNKYHRYSNQRYKIQIASFSDKGKAMEYAKKLQENKFKLTIMKINMGEIYYRIMIDDINYYELQTYRIRLHNSGINKYLVLNK